MKTSRLTLLIILCAILSSCATIYGRQNDKERVFFDANAEAAKITCAGESTLTPGNLELKQSKTHTCSASAEGYMSEDFRVWSKLSVEGFKYSSRVNWDKWGKWTLGIGNLLAWPVDFVSGSMKSLEQDRYEIELNSDADTSFSKKVLSRTTSATKSIAVMPMNTVEDTATTVLDTTLRTAAEGVGLVSVESREETEKVIEGKEIAARLKEASPDNA